MTDKPIVVTSSSEGDSIDVHITGSGGPVDTGVIHRTAAIRDVCKWLRLLADSGKWPNKRPFFTPAEPASIGRCATEIEEAFLGKSG